MTTTAPTSFFSRRLAASALAALATLLPLMAQAYPARGGGGFRGGGFADRGSSGGYHFGGSTASSGDWRSGYQGSHPMYGPGTRPAWGGISTNRDSINRTSLNDTSLNRSSLNRTSLNNTSLNRTSLNNTSLNRTTVNRNFDTNNNFYNRDYNGWNSNWRNGGYWNDRPWSTGWFGGGASTWGWWGANAVGWGLAGLATGAAIGGLVNAAAEQSSPVFLVPQTSYQLNYGSVESVGTYGVSFNYLVNGTQLLGAANCQQGLLNGQIPSDGDQAQLLNAVCQVAYGTGT